MINLNDKIADVVFDVPGIEEVFEKYHIKVFG